MPPPPLPYPTVMASRAHLPVDVRLDMGPLGIVTLDLDTTDEIRRTAREELRETEDVVAEALVALRKRLQEEKDLVAPLDDEALTILLRPCHWYVEPAFERAKNFYKLRALYLPLRGVDLERVTSAGVNIILPRRDQHGRRMLLLQTGRQWDPKKVSMDELLRVALMCMEVAVVEPLTQVHGCVILWDLDGLTLSQVLKFTPSFAKTLLHLVQDCVPLRVKAFHFINQTNLFDIAFKVFKPFLREKLKSRLYLHGKDMSSLHDHIDPKCLPKKYGGVHELRFTPEKYVPAFHLFDQYFEELNKFGYKKPPK